MSEKDKIEMIAAAIIIVMLVIGLSLSVSDEQIEKTIDEKIGNKVKLSTF